MRSEVIDIEGVRPDIFEASNALIFLYIMMTLFPITVVRLPWTVA